MSARVYILVDLVHADSAQVAQNLQGKLGVVEIDVLDGRPRIMMVIEASERLKAAEYLVDVLNSMDGVIEDLQVLPVDQSIVKNPAEIERSVRS